MDLPAPVSPVRTFRPDAKSSVTSSIRTRSRTLSVASIATLERAGERPADPGTFIYHRRHVVAHEEIVRILVPRTARIVRAQNSGGGLGLVVNAECVIRLGQPLQRLGDLCRLLVTLHHHAEAVDGADIVAAN